jgi:hypothetical protein
MTAPEPSELVLAIYPFARGIAFALFEGPLSPVDWGIKRVRGKRKRMEAFDLAKELIERSQPDVVILQAHRSNRSLHARRVGRLDAMIATYAAGQAIDCHRYARTDIRLCFQHSGAVTRYEIAQAIAGHVTAFSHRVPPVRKLWQSEDERMGLFDAASLVMTYFSSLPARKAATEPAA